MIVNLEGFPNAKILIVDDTPTNLTVLFKSLKSHFQVFAALTGEAALDIVNKNKPDIILLDILMPGISGFDVCKELKKNENAKNIPVIFMSALSETVNKVKGFELGAVDYITKPFQIEEVLARITTQLTLCKLRSELESSNKLLEKRVEERTAELQKAKEEAEMNSRLKTSLLSNMSHEFRTPMNGILGYSEMLEDDLTNEIHRDFAMKIHASGRRLMKTLNLILQLAELESSQKLEKNDKIHLGNFANLLKDEFTHLAELNNLRLYVDIKDEAIGISCESERLYNIVTNLIDNAIKFTEVGNITLIVESEKNDDELYGILRVKDTGIGIAQEKQEVIFHAFRQASEGFSRIYEGSGLGLTLSKKMTELMNGTMTLESEPGHGSIFSVILPGIRMTSDEEFIENDEILVESEPEEPVIEEPVNKKPKVLLVEDNEMNIFVTENFLNELCVVESTKDGLTALKMASITDYDIILLDINLGAGMNGLEVVKEIKKMSGYENTPVVALTGYVLIQEKEKLMAEGCTHYLPKPFSRWQIRKMVQGILNDA